MCVILPIRFYAQNICWWCLAHGCVYVHAPNAHRMISSLEIRPCKLCKCICIGRVRYYNASIPNMPCKISHCKCCTSIQPFFHQTKSIFTLALREQQQFDGRLLVTHTNAYTPLLSIKPNGAQKELQPV